MSEVLRQIWKRLKQFKQYGYDLPASRKFLLKRAGINKGSILEVGTGKGHLAVEIAKNGMPITSVDSDSGQLSIARRHLKALKLDRSVTLVKMNAEKLRFKNRSFDTVVSIDFFHHAESPSRCLKEMIRVAQNTLVIADLNKRGERMMERVHQEENHHHPVTKIAFKGIRKHLQDNHFVVRVYKKNCHTYLIANRKD
ncbi:MAG: hypothetical protein A3G33_07625 [Omnitrophica bacterium RIFCSPLOWO2_12_FULL_44_17]|uniref:Methyltransferase type 11 domain-containing protein n=1 Tax=Candidatus Danuiimicrobium aquiferis TaxID=1801832 RepID=A0A1G1KYU8_9BACT|nr:MAG: hypothetical protein A3B72_07925 [Omnitrophica bacterium RIFCSPHIGHO2_02_FULL_45_28]OGW91461.1 MAG: hypothetical protein A3E74_00760 [Omnitrophica bacterium RIFCSPHIGHO2_12_FULL_44_12]OGW98087.1 MAG: hypothetical protein A3G33_07625 [Omnitrophica bacterium RIFCSPLOWO2_12_FULL_44_17]OGX03471.1 MAG: hypothetical protein A3J12_02600 [Omnitrophica bacterium RIFCSPLOWO2_02_FULL_44_11]